jgi:hypothetical protein
MDRNDLYEEFISSPITITPARLRTKIRKLLTSTDIKIGEFQKMLSVNANSYGKFMNGKYKDPWSATQNGTYVAAAFFFYMEERLGKQALGKTRARHATTSSSSPRATTDAVSKTKSRTGGAKPALPDVRTTQLENGHTWLTPGEVRKGLQDLQLTFDTSVAGLARMADVPYQSFNNFVKAGGMWGAKDNQAYPRAAALVEKVRIQLQKPKSAKRKALEAEVEAGIVHHRTGGPKLGLDPDGKYYGPPGAYMAKDSLGRHYLAY